MTRAEFFVLGRLHPGSAPWVLNTQGPQTRADCERAINWQGRGQPDPHCRWDICTVKPDAFVTLDGETLHPCIGPYTSEAWAAFCERVGYVPPGLRDMVAQGYTQAAARYELASRLSHSEPWDSGSDRGMRLTMGDGSTWFHPYSGKAPKRLSPPTV